MRTREDLTKPLLERVFEAIDAGDKEAAKAAAQKMWTESNEVRQVTAKISSCLITYIADNMGEEKVRDAWVYVGEQVWKPQIEGALALDYEGAVDAYASIMRGLGSKFTIEQDDEKAIVTVNCCGSAGRMRKEGNFDNTDRDCMSCGTTKKAYPWSFNKTGMSYYCVHAPVWFNEMPKEWGIGEGLMTYDTWGRQYDDEGNEIDEPCRVIVRNKATL
jgi:hypothetical protein